MKRICNFLLSFCLVLGLCACGQAAQSAPTWQEQYDLGIRYLSEGNYEEAIIAFTAAIQIDPKQADAYITLADVYTAQGDTEKAKDILNQALEAIGETAELLAALEALQTPTETVDMTPAAAHGDLVSFSGAGREMTLSLQWQGLPAEVYSDGGNDYSAVFTMSVSDGNETFRVWTNPEGETSGMLSVLDGEAWVNDLSAAYHPEDDVNDVRWRNVFAPVSVSRSGETLTWNIQLPEGSFAASDVRYVGYFLYYSLSADSYDGHGSAAYAVENGTLVRASDDILENLGYILTEEEMKARYSV